MTTLQANAFTAAEFTALFEQVKNWGRWGPDDQRGALNLITDAKRAQAAALVTLGRTVSAANPLPLTPGPNNHQPVIRAVLAGGDVADPGGAYLMDVTVIAPHGTATSHMDALCHVFWDRLMYNGYPAGKMTSTGAAVNGIDVAREGVVSRGVLLDVPRALGKDFLAGGEAIYPDDLGATETAQGVHVEQGDILLVHTGRHRRERVQGETSLIAGGAGLHATTLPWLSSRGIAVLGSDGISDVLPSGCVEVFLPIHVGTIVAMGVHLLDNLALEDLATTCAELGRWTFQFIVAPLIIEQGTGSAVNPIAIF